MFDGQRDLDAAAASLAKRIPYPLGGLARLAYNYGWSWQPGGGEMFERIDPQLWPRVSRNPVAMLQEASATALRRSAADHELLGRVASAEAELAAELAREPAGGASAVRAFFCAEYAVHASLPIYSGGLGALAGDFLKQASDDAAALVGVGLFYREGYFRQRIDATGLQHEYWVAADPDRLPLALVTGADGAPLTVSVPIAGESVTVAIPALTSRRISSSAANAAWPSLRCSRSAATPIASRARTPPAPSSMYWARRTSGDPTYRRETIQRAAREFSGRSLSSR